MDGFFTFIVFIFVGFVFGYLYRELVFFKDLLRISKNISKIREAKEDLDDKVKPLRHEIIGDMHYFYHAKDDNFVCQGLTLTDAAVAFAKITNPEQHAIFKSAEDDKFYVFVNNQCLEWNNATKQ